MLMSANRMPPLTPLNPMDVSTIVSIVPRKENKPIEIIKHTLTPGVFKVPSGSYENPGILHVGSSYWLRDIDPKQPFIQVTSHSIIIAESIVKDYTGAVFGRTADAKPGMFHVNGKLTAAEIKTQHKDKLDKAKTQQENWFKNLVKAADAMYARTNGNPLSIGDNEILAAQSLGITDRPWLMIHKHYEKLPCKACGQYNNASIIVCPNCKVILDEKAFAAAGLKFA